MLCSVLRDGGEIEGAFFCSSALSSHQSEASTLCTSPKWENSSLCICIVFSTSFPINSMHGNSERCCRLYAKISSGESVLSTPHHPRLPPRTRETIVQRLGLLAFCDDVPTPSFMVRSSDPAVVRTFCQASPEWRCCTEPSEFSNDENTLL